MSLSDFVNIRSLRPRRKSTRYAAAIHMCLTGISKIVVFFAILILAKKLSVKDFGYYSLIQTFLLYAGLSHLGLLSAHIKEYPILIAQGKKEDAHNLFLSSFYASILLTGIFSFLIALWLFNRYSSMVLAISFFITAVLFQITSFGIQYFRANQDFKLFNLISFLQTVTPAVLLAVLALAIPRVAVYCGFVLSFFVLAVLCWWHSVGKIYQLGQKWSYYYWVKNGFKIGFPIYMIMLFNILLKSIDRLFVAQFYELGTFASYSLGIRLAETVNIAAFTIGAVYFPVLLTYMGQKDYDKARLLVKGLTKIIVLLGVTTMGCLVVLNESFLKGYFIKYPGYDCYMYIISVATCFWSWSQMYIYYFTASAPYFLLKIQVVMSLIMLASLAFIALTKQPVICVPITMLCVIFLYVVVIIVAYKFQFAFDRAGHS